MRTVTLKEFGIGKYDDRSAFPIGDLSIEITGFLKINGEYRYFAYMNNEKIVQRTISADDNVIEIEQSLLAAGILKSIVEVYLDGEKVKTFKIENLIIKDEGGALKADPEIAAVVKREEAIEEDNKKIHTEITELEDSESKTEKGLEAKYAEFHAFWIALMKFAYNAYNSIPYLNGGELTALAKEIGLDMSVFTDEDIKLITGAD